MNYEPINIFTMPTIEIALCHNQETGKNFTINKKGLQMLMSNIDQSRKITFIKWQEQTEDKPIKKENNGTGAQSDTQKSIEVQNTETAADPSGIGADTNATSGSEETQTARSDADNSFTTAGKGRRGNPNLGRKKDQKIR